MTIGEWLTLGWRELDPFTATPRLDAEVLLAQALETDREALIRDRDEEIPARAAQDFREMLQRRKNHEPVHYISSQREFWSLPFHLNGDVFIPRPETELVVERALEMMSERPRQGAPILAADLCTGSGNIAAALATEFPGCTVHAVDISTKALACARDNLENLGLAGRVKLLKGDLFSPLRGMAGMLDLIVSNPPYVTAAEMEELPPEVCHYEPHLALYGGPDGLDHLRRIIAAAPDYLKAGGALVMEMGKYQGETLLRLMEAQGWYNNFKIGKDYAGLARVISAIKIS